VTVSVNDVTPRCQARGCGIALRLSRSIAEGLCCCHRDDHDADFYVDLINDTTPERVYTPARVG